MARHNVERALRWPRLADDLSGIDGDSRERVTVWLASPPIGNAENPSSILVVTCDRRGFRHVQDAWRVYHSDVSLSRVRSAREALHAFLDRYGVELQIGSATRRLFTGCRIAMGPAGNSDAGLPAAAASADVRLVQILELIPESAQIEVSIGYAVNESAVRADLARHTRHSTPSRELSPRVRREE